MRTLPVQELDFSTLPPGLPHIITYDSKWNRDSVEYHTRTERAGPMPKGLLEHVEQLAHRCFRSLEVSDYGRCDIRLAADGTPYVIDVNPNCDLSHDGGFGRAAARAGLDYEAFLWEILRSALRRRTDSGVLFASRGRSPRRRPATPPAAHFGGEIL